MFGNKHLLYVWCRSAPLNIMPQSVHAAKAWPQDLAAGTGNNKKHEPKQSAKPPGDKAAKEKKPPKAKTPEEEAKKVGNSRPHMY